MKELQAAQWTEVRSDTRQAGAVLRYHTWPTVKKQTIADHSWNVWRIVFAIWRTGHCSVEGIPQSVTEYIMLHDCGELRTGDAPYPIKRDNPELKQIMDRLEDEALTEQGIHLAELSTEWKWRVKVAHTIEMMEFGIDELMLGSRYAAPVILRMTTWLREQLADANVPPNVWSDEVSAVLNYVDARLDRAARLDGHCRAALELLRDPPAIVSRPTQTGPGTPEDGGQHARYVPTAGEAAGLGG